MPEGRAVTHNVTHKVYIMEAEGSEVRLKLHPTYPTLPIKPQHVKSPSHGQAIWVPLMIKLHGTRALGQVPLRLGKRVLLPFS